MKKVEIQMVNFGLEYKRAKTEALHGLPTEWKAEKGLIKYYYRGSLIAVEYPWRVFHMRSSSGFLILKLR